jgi:hypothetical protein
MNNKRYSRSGVLTAICTVILLMCTRKKLLKLRDCVVVRKVLTCAAGRTRVRCVVATRSADDVIAFGSRTFV